MKKPKKTKAIKAVKFWKSAGGSYAYPNKKCAQYFSGLQAPSVKPVAVLPMDAESVERMVEEIGMTIAAMSGTSASDEDVARAALAAIGVKGGAK
jgi:hypothetical protein